MFYATPQFVDVYHIKRKEKVGQALGYLINNWGIVKMFCMKQPKEELDG